MEHLLDQSGGLLQFDDIEAIETAAVITDGECFDKLFDDAAEALTVIKNYILQLHCIQCATLYTADENYQNLSGIV